MRQILHHGPTPDGTTVILDDRAISGCWFDLHRQGGCGAGEVVLQRDFHERRAIEIGDWISCESAPGQRVYLGRVEECRYQVPGLLRVRLMGMAIELNEVFPGGFGASSSEQRPHRYGATDLFSNDPDRQWELAFPASTVQELVRLLLSRHVQNQTHIQYVPSRVESPQLPLSALSLKFRGEESIRSILKDLALRAQANWGVDAQGQFFFTRRRTSLQSTLKLGRDLVSWEELRDRELLFNRLLLTGDYIYDKRDRSGQIARRVYRWRANYFEPNSCRRHGNRRLRLWVPWIRTQADSLNFAREFFRLYSEPTPRFSVETTPGSSIVLPWDGEVGLEDSLGSLIGRGVVDKVRVLFDHALRMRLEIGPEDPREQWPEPPQDERWELPDHFPSNGGHVSVTELSSGGGGGGGSSSVQNSSQFTSDPTSDLSSNESSSLSSDQSSDGSEDLSESSQSTTETSESSLDSTGGSDLSSATESSGSHSSLASSSRHLSSDATSLWSTVESSEQPSESDPSSGNSHDGSSNETSLRTTSTASSSGTTSCPSWDQSSGVVSSDQTISSSDEFRSSESDQTFDSTDTSTDGTLTDSSTDGTDSHGQTDSSLHSGSTPSLHSHSGSWPWTTDLSLHSSVHSQSLSGSGEYSSSTNLDSTDFSSNSQSRSQM